MNRFIPPDLLRLRRDSLRAITGILEHETRFRLGFSAMAAALERAHRRLAATLGALRDGCPPEAFDLL